jgi:hypothetical protein
MSGIRYRAADARQRKVEREAEQFVESFKLAKCREERCHGRWLLKGNWSWAEVVTLSNGIYVGGDIDSVVFQGHPDNYGPRSAVYWMATRSYGYAKEKASRGDTQAVSWDRSVAREAIVWMRRDKGLTKDAARDIVDLLDSECDQSHFVEALYENQDDCESLDAGEVTAMRVYMATAVLRKLVWLLETRDFRDSARSWFLASEAA